MPGKKTIRIEEKARLIQTHLCGKVSMSEDAESVNCNHRAQRNPGVLTSMGKRVLYLAA